MTNKNGRQKWSEDGATLVHSHEKRSAGMDGVRPEYVPVMIDFYHYCNYLMELLVAKNRPKQEMFKRYLESARIALIRLFSAATPEVTAVRVENLKQTDNLFKFVRFSAAYKWNDDVRLRFKDEELRDILTRINVEDLDPLPGRDFEPFISFAFGACKIHLDALLYDH